MSVPVRALGLLVLVAAMMIGFSQSSTAPPSAGDGYIDSVQCAACHSEIASTYARTAMGRSFQRVQAGPVLAEFDGVMFEHALSGQFFTPAKNGNGYAVRRHQAGGANVLERSVDFVFGSGNHARSYLHRSPAGTLTMMPVSWYRDKGWAMSPAFDRADHLGFNRVITYRCMFCHTGYPEIPLGAGRLESGSAFPGAIPNGIDCQRCHGPGATHVALAKRAAAPAQLRAAIVNPARLTKVRQLEVCMQCHLETTSLDLPPAVMKVGREVFSYRPGEPLENYIQHFDHAPNTGHDDKFELVSAVYRMSKSKCFLQSAGAMTCTTCHNPHRTPVKVEADAQFNKACQNCHTALAESHPVGACASCHMPKRRPSDATRIVITDHLIRRTPMKSADPAKEEHSGNTPPYVGRVVPYYPVRADLLTTAVAQVRQQANIAEGIAQLTAWVEQNRPVGGDAYYELGSAWRSAGRADKAVLYFRDAVAKEPRQWHYHFGLGSALTDLGQWQPALLAHQTAQTLAPKELAVHYAIADIYSKQGNLRAARATLERAITLDIERPEGHNNLGVLLLVSGDRVGALSALKEAIRLNPENAATHGNLARAFAQSGNAREAKDQFEIVVKLLAGNATATQRAEAYVNLGMAWIGLQNGEQGKRNFRLALEVDSESALANLNLGAALTSERQFGEARPFLQKAAQSSDSGVKAAALATLAKHPQ